MPGVHSTGIRGTLPRHGHTCKDGNRQISQEYNSWAGMKGRCCNPKNQKYPDYGGRGITVCDRWLHSFENFLADMGQKPSARHQLDRIDNDGNYEPGNCRWATLRQQGRNKRNNRVLAHAGESMPLSAWAEKLGISRKTLVTRLHRGWTVERALTY